MSNRLVTHLQNIKSKSPQKKEGKKVSVETSLNVNALEKVKELEAKVVHLSRLLKDGKKHAGLELQAATTKKRLAKAKEIYKINTLMNVKSPTDDKHSDYSAAGKNKLSTSTSKEYGNYYSMRATILHMEVHKQTIIEAKGLQGFLTEYQDKLAKCFQFEQNQIVRDLFATSRIHKLNEKTSDIPKALKATDSEYSMREVMMEQDLETLVSIDSSCSSILNDGPDLSETNFLGQFLKDKVFEFVQAAASSNDGPTFSFDIRNVAESVSDMRLEELMTVRPQINRSAASVKEGFQDLKLSKLRGQSFDITDMIPMKSARAMTNIKKSRKSMN